MITKVSYLRISGLILAGSPLLLNAQTISWIGGNGLWSNAANWSAGIPSSANSVVIQPGFTTEVDLDRTILALTTESDLIVRRYLAGASSDQNSALDFSGDLEIDGGALANWTINAQPGAGPIRFSSSPANGIDRIIFNADLAFGQGGYTRVYGANTLQSGSISLDSGLTGGLQFHDATASLKLTTGTQLAGAGQLTNFFGGGTLVLDGGLVLSRATANGSELRIAQSNTSGSGVLAAAANSTLRLSTALSATVSALAGNNARILIDGGTFSGTLLGSTGTGLSFSTAPGNAIDAATVNGPTARLTFGEGSYARLYNATSIINGAVILNSSQTGGLQFHDANAQLILGADGVLSGAGQLTNFFGGGTLALAGGTVRSEVMPNGSELRIAQSNTSGSGALVAENDTTLRLSTNLTASVTADALGSGVILFDGGTFAGALGNSTGTGLSFSTAPGNAITGATLNGTGAQLTFGNGSYARLFNQTQILEGSIQMASGLAGGLQFHDGTTELKLGTGTQIAGSGQLTNFFGGGSLVLEGGSLRSQATAAGTVLNISQSNTRGNGQLVAEAGSTLRLSTGLSASVTTETVAGGVILVDGGTFSGILRDSTGTGLSFSGAPGNAIQDATVSGAGARLTFQDGSYSRLYGLNQINQGSVVMDSSLVGGLQFHDGATVLQFGPGTELRGSGQLTNFFGNGLLRVTGATVRSEEGANGSILDLSQDRTESDGGTFEAAAGSVLTLDTTLRSFGMGTTIRTEGDGRVELNGGNFIGRLAGTEGAGLAIASSPGNALGGADPSDYNGTVAFGSDSYARLFGMNRIESGTFAFSSPTATLQFHDGSTALEIKPGAKLSGEGNLTQFFGGGLLSNEGSIEASVNGGTLTLQLSRVSNRGTFLSVPGATLSVANGFTQSGSSSVTTVGGQLTVGGTGMVLEGGLLEGSGMINGSVTNTGGVVAPGNSPGLLQIHGTYAQSSFGLLAIEIGGTTPGLWDVLSIDGTASLGGGLEVSTLPGVLIAPGDTFRILTTTGSLTGLFTSFAQSHLWDVHYGSNYVDIIASTVIPEPATLAWLLGALCLGVTILRKRRQS